MSDADRKAKPFIAWLARIGALTAGALILAACADDADDVASSAVTRPASSATDVVVTGTDSVRFDPDALTLPAGEEVSLTFSAEGGVEHDFVVEDAADAGEARADDPAPVGDIGKSDLPIVHADRGQTTEATFLIDEPGIYTVYCSVPGHRDSGMVATLTVEDGS